MLALSGCATEQELGCRRAQEVAEADARLLGGAAAVAVYLILVSALILIRRPRRTSGMRILATGLLGLVAAAAACLLGLLAGQVVAGARDRCGQEFVLFSERADMLVYVVVVGVLAVALLTLVLSLTNLASLAWRRR